MKELIEKQAIEEMAKDIGDVWLVSLDGDVRCLREVLWSVDIENIAIELNNIGYRKQKYGKWEKRTFIIFDSEKVGYNCSECNTTWDTETKFCPNCGAKMKGGE